MPTYDRADWHNGAENFPRTLPPEAGGTHIGMFLAWAILSGLESEMHRAESRDAVDAVRARRMTGREFLFQQRDEKLTDNDFNEEGNAFATSYYGSTNSPYLADYERTFARGGRSLYKTEDTWANYELIAPSITEAFEAWKRRKARPWWRFWANEA
jgi:hypothetical protein